MNKLISGGQTGVDRAGLEAAIQLGLAHGGWCPKGRVAEDGTVPRRYQLDETKSNGYVQRTSWNVRDSDATVIISPELKLGRGSALTVREAVSQGKPYLVLTGPELAGKPAKLAAFILEHQVKVLNVAGPRASSAPTGFKHALELLLETLNQVIHRVPTSCFGS